MLRYVAGRVGRACITIFLVLSIVFLLMRLMPVETFFDGRSDTMSDTVKENILRQLGLLDPWYKELPRYWNRLAHGDLGESITMRVGVPCGKIVWPKAKVSFQYGIIALCIQLCVGMPLGVMMARKKGGIVDKVGNLYVLLINALPQAVYFLLIQLYLSTWLNLPMIVDRQGSLPSRILPIICLSLGGIASNAMWMRRYMVDQLNMDYIRLARAKGMTSTQVAFRHIFRNALVPMVQSLPASLLFTISGSLYVESLFSINGMGGLLVTSIQRQDNPLVQTMVLLYSVISVLGLLLGDIAMGLVDPRITFTKKGGSR